MFTSFWFDTLFLECHFMPQMFFFVNVLQWIVYAFTYKQIVDDKNWFGLRRPTWYIFLVKWFVLWFKVLFWLDNDWSNDSSSKIKH